MKSRRKFGMVLDSNRLIKLIMRKRKTDEQKRS